MRKIFLLIILLSLFKCHITPQNRKKVLWLGTSIPCGCTYPDVACKNLQMDCINKSVGASFLTMWSKEKGFYNQSSGLSLVMSRDEKEETFRPYVELGIISESTLEYWKSTSYESLVLPYLKDVDLVIIDHGYNDDFSIEKIYNEGEENIDWESQDKSNFIGAFNFIYNLIKENQPHALVIIGGYFQNSCTISWAKRGLWVSNVSSWISNHYNIPLLDTWNYTDIPDGYMPDSSGYLNQLNITYGTSFESVFPDSQGNITYFQKFCPDGVHPFSEPTGESDRILNSIVCDLLKKIVSDQTTIPLPTVTGFQQPYQYGLDGIRIQHTDRKKIMIEKKSNHTRKVLR